MVKRVGGIVAVGISFMACASFSHETGASELEQAARIASAALESTGGPCTPGGTPITDPFECIMPKAVFNCAPGYLGVEGLDDKGKCTCACIEHPNHCVYYPRTARTVNNCAPGFRPIVGIGSYPLTETGSCRCIPDDRPGDGGIAVDATTVP
jgi:hypothetical protein